MIIRKCLPEETAAVGQFYDSIVEYLDAHVNYPKWKYKEYPTGTWVGNMVKAGWQYVCLNGNEIVGAFALNQEPQGKFEKGNWTKDISYGNYLVIHALAIHPEGMRGGMGASVLNWCFDYAKENGYQAIRVDVVPENLPARTFFEKNGYQYVGDEDLERNIENIPFFSLYEKNV